MKIKLQKKNFGDSFEASNFFNIFFSSIFYKKIYLLLFLFNVIQKKKKKNF